MFKLQIRNEQDYLLTEWPVGDDADIPSADVLAHEIEWLQRPFDDEGKTNAQALAEGLLYEVGADG